MGSCDKTYKGLLVGYLHSAHLAWLPEKLDTISSPRQFFEPQSVRNIAEI